MSDDPEVLYVIRRVDGEPVYDCFTFMQVGGPDDWTAAEEYDDGDPVEFEMVRMVVEPISRRTFPECRESGCTAGATYWGLCEKHAREDDPDAFT